MKLTDLPTGGLEDCDCGEPGRGFTKISVPELAPTPPKVREPTPQISIPIPTPEPEPQQQMPSIDSRTPVVRYKRPRSKGTGQFCVFSHKGNVVHCYHDEAKAKKVASAFAKRAGTKFTVRRR